MNKFIPERPEVSKLTVPFYEDQQKIVGSSVTKSLDYYEKRVKETMTRLGAYNVVLMLGNFPGQSARYGYQITFNLSNIPGRIDCAALPMRSETKVKKERALCQALYLLGNWLEAELFSTIYRPGSIPLVPYLIGSGDKTVTESLIELQELPLLKG